MQKLPSPRLSFSVQRQPELDEAAALLVHEHKAAPCACIACAYRTPRGWQLGQGAAGHLWENGPQASPETLFDLASVTKPFTALAMARVVRQHLVGWSTPLGLLVAEALGGPSAGVPLELLLAHRAGLDGHRPLYELVRSGHALERYRALREAAWARREECPGEGFEQGFSPLYSDLGYLLLGEALSRASGLAFDELIAREVCEPLGLQLGSARQWESKDPAFAERVAPTEVVGWRGGLVRGAVHDENAWMLGGFGACGHAGLFASAKELAMLGASVLDALGDGLTAWLPAELLEPLVRVRPGGTLRAGFDGKSSVDSSAGQYCSSQSFGHLGFTGTSLWIDPAQQLVAVVLSNRVHPSRSNESIKRARPAVHDALFRWAQEQKEQAGSRGYGAPAAMDASVLEGS